MGGKINKSQYAEVNGKRIYVCCAGCISKIKAEPAKYIKQLESNGVELEKATAKKDTTKSKSGCGGCGSH
jgi:YHS domain-containing protein